MSKYEKELMNSFFGRVYEYYFSRPGPIKSPILGISVYGTLLLGFLALVISAFNSSVGFQLLIGAGIWFFSFFIFHIFLWVIGSVYKSGLVNCISLFIIVVFGMIALIIIGGILLFGWTVPVLFVILFYETTIPEPLNSWFEPLLIIFSIVFAFAWYAKGVSIFEDI